MTETQRKRIIFVCVPPIDEMDFIGPMKVLGAANRLSKQPVYDVEVVTTKKDLVVKGEEGLFSFAAQARLEEVKGKFDSVLLMCGAATRNDHDPELSVWIRRTAPRVRRFGAVCVASFLLARAGILDAKRATAHWRFSEELSKSYPRVKVESDPIWVKDGNLYTSAGVSAGIDMSLAWVEEDCGAAIAQEIARELVLFLRRSGDQKQMSVSLSAQASQMKAIQELQVWILENVHKKLSVPMLASRVAMSVRHFERVFTREIGEKPSRYLLKLRVEAARQQLERTDRGLKQIASICGFGNPAVMSRAFQRCLGISPHRYRHEVARMSRPRG